MVFIPETKTAKAWYDCGRFYFCFSLKQALDYYSQGLQNVLQKERCNTHGDWGVRVGI
jgi:hypothetical protein